MYFKLIYTVSIIMFGKKPKNKIQKLNKNKMWNSTKFKSFTRNIIKYLILPCNTLLYAYIEYTTEKNNPIEEKNIIKKFNFNNPINTKNSPIKFNVSGNPKLLIENIKKKYWK